MSLRALQILFSPSLLCAVPSSCRRCAIAVHYICLSLGHGSVLDQDELEQGNLPAKGRTKPADVNEFAVVSDIDVAVIASG